MWIFRLHQYGIGSHLQVPIAPPCEDRDTFRRAKHITESLHIRRGRHDGYHKKLNFKFTFKLPVALPISLFPWVGKRYRAPFDSSMRKRRLRHLKQEIRCSCCLFGISSASNNSVLYRQLRGLHNINSIIREVVYRFESMRDHMYSRSSIYETFGELKTWDLAAFSQLLHEHVCLREVGIVISEAITPGSSTIWASIPFCKCQPAGHRFSVILKCSI